jgi:CHAT domain-containing protein
VVLQDTKASISQALRISDEESKRNSKTAIVLATHGVAVDYASGVTLPGLLSSDDGSLSLVTNLQLESFDLQSSVVALSACDTATGFTDRSDQYFTGFVTSFANSGSDVVVASLWPVISSASKNLTEKFFAEWKASNFMNGVRSSKVAVNDNYAGLPFVYIYP